MIRKLSIAATVAVLASTASMAGTYFGGALGQASTEHDVSNVNFDGDSTGWKIYWGSRFMKFFGAEASYIDFGSPDATIGGETWKASSQGGDAFLVGALPIGSHLELFVKAGIVYVNAETTILGAFKSISDTSSAYGAGAVVIFGGHLGVRLEAEKFEVSDLDSLWMYSLGLEFRF